jgi:hypothetical protein
VAGTSIKSNQVDEELNQLVSGHNSHDTSIQALNAVVSGKLGRNLLDNWYFKNPVNQWNRSSVSAIYQTLIDRWTILRYVSGSATLTASGITINGDFDLGEVIESSRLPSDANLVVTISVRLADGTVVSKTSTLLNNGSSEAIVHELSTFKLVFIRNWLTGKDLFFVVSTATDVTFVSAKLELGSVSTLIYDPPANYSEELTKCQRYCVAYGQYAQFEGVDFQPNSIDFTIIAPCNMSAVPSIVNAENIILVSNGTNQSGFTFTVAATSGNNLRFRATKTSHGLTNAFIETTGLVLFTADV